MAAGREGHGGILEAESEEWDGFAVLDFANAEFSGA